MQPRSIAVQQPFTRVALWGVLMAILLGWTLAISALDAKSFWGDEILTVRVSRPNSVAILGHMQEQRNAPLSYLVFHLFVRMDAGEFATRFPSALVAVIALAATYQLGRLFFGRRTALLAVALLAMSPTHVRYAQEARMYALYEALSVFSLYFFYQALTQRRLSLWLAYAATTLLSTWAHQLSLLFVASQVAFLSYTTLEEKVGRKRPAGSRLGSSRNWLAFAISLVVVIGMSLPWVPIPSSEGGSAAAPLTQRPGDVLLGIWEYIWGGQNTLLPWILGGLVLLGLQSAFRSGRDSKGWLLLFWTAFAMPLIYVVFFVLAPHHFAIRYVIFLLPIYVILAAQGAVALSEALARLVIPRSNTPASHLALVLALLVGILNVGPLSRYYTEHKPPWRELGAFLTTHVRAGEVILVQPSWQEASLKHYTRLEDQIVGSEQGDALKRTLTTHETIWFVHPESANQSERGRLIDDWIRQGRYIRLTFSGNRWLSARDREIIRTHKDLEVKLYRKDWETDRDVLEEGLALITDAEIRWPGALRADLSKARLLARYGDHNMAIAAYERALGELPDYVAGEAYAELGNVYRGQGNLDAALVAHGQALQLRPHHPWYRVLFADGLTAVGRYHEGIEAYEQAGRLEPSYFAAAWYYTRLGRAYQLSGRSKEAITAYRQALRLDPDHQQTLRWLRELR